MDWLATVTVNMLRQRVHDLPARAFSAQALLSRAATLVLSACCGLMTCSALMAQPQGSWLTIVGDPTDPAVDTIEVDPVPLSVNADTRTMRIRVSRARQRNNWDGVPYRSFNSEVLFECGGNTARYVAMEYFMQPGWKGSPHAVMRYNSGEPRPMRFMDVMPNPTARILRAVCQSSGVTSN